jgi:hypothetical protein
MVRSLVEREDGTAARLGNGHAGDDDDASARRRCRDGKRGSKRGRDRRRPGSFHGSTVADHGPSSREESADATLRR